ncbi:hypothetical protein NUM3379_39310 [Kineococcus sp. NUM-3379]
MDDRRHRVERRKVLDLTRSERGEPERRAFPGVERRDLEHRDPPAPPPADDLPADEAGDGPGTPGG